jgi:environmental stress-induced protein Ves
MKLVTKECQKVSEWTGGTTSELLIFPENSTVSKQNFDYRISTAKVLVEKSEFTSFPNFNRKLAILEGKLKIQHNQSAWYFLESGDQTEFSGDWKTKSEGQVVDFNVIYSDEYQVELDFVSQINCLPKMDEIELFGVYCINGMGRLNGIVFHKGDFVSVQEVGLKVESSENSRFIQVKITKL